MNDSDDLLIESLEAHDILQQPDLRSFATKHGTVERYGLDSKYNAVKGSTGLMRFKFVMTLNSCLQLSSLRSLLA